MINPGAKVKLVNSEGMNIGVGATATVGKNGIWYDLLLKEILVDIVWDKDNEYYKNQLDGGYYAKNFKLVEAHSAIDAEKLADKILNLINSKPRSPFREEIIEIVKGIK